MTIHRRHHGPQRPWTAALFISGLLAVCCLTPSWCLAAPPSSREPVHPRRNVDEFPPVQAKFVRFTVLMTNRGEPGLDELEIYTSGTPSTNVALASRGARVTASGSYPGYKIHELANVNDGRYGNGHAWIADRVSNAWVQVELPATMEINQVVWGRDREGKFVDRLVTQYRIETAVDTNRWRLVASSDDREPLHTGAELASPNPIPHQAVPRFAPASSQQNFPPRTQSAEYVIDNWQSEHGLPGNAVTALCQSQRGYLWVATLNGLARFDGDQFAVFGEKEGLHNPRLLCLAEGQNRTLWMGTEGGGLVRFQDGTFTSFNTGDGLWHDVVLALEMDAQGRLWIGTMGGVNCVVNGRISTDPKYRLATGQGVSRIAAGPANDIWILSTRLYQWNQGDLTPPLQPDEPAEFSSLFTAHAGSAGRLWYGGANGYVGCLSNQTVTIHGTAEGLAPENIWELLESRNGDLWVGTASGGLRRLRDGRFTALTAQDGLSDNSVRSLLEDREGNLWVGTSSGGLNRLKPRQVVTYSVQDGLSHDVITSMAEDEQGDLYVGSNCGGLNVRLDDQFQPQHLSYLLDNACIWPVLIAQDQSLWLGTWGNGLFHRSSNGLTNYLAGNGLPDEFVLALHEDHREDTQGLWIGTYQGGLSRLANGQFTTYNTQHGLSAPWVTAIVPGEKDSLWIGTSGGGLNRFSQNQFSVYRRADGLGSDFVRALYRDTNGTLWIGTGGGGLSRLHDGKFTTLTRDHGLPDDVISQIVEDDRGRLWCGSNQGIFRLDKDELEAFAEGKIQSIRPVRFGKSEGMISLECTGGFSPAGLKSRDGKLWFSTVKGLVCIDPQSLSPNDLPPPVWVEEIHVDGEPAPFPADRHLRIQAGQSLAFRYTAICLTAPERVRFRHRLHGLDQDWVEAESRRLANYTHLPPGNHRFQVIACNNDGLWNETGASLAITVLPPFWQTWWFATVSAAVFLGTAGWAVRYVSVRRWRRRLDRLERQHALEKERTRIAKDIHDDIGASLTQISYLTEMGRKDQSRPSAVAKHLNRIADMAVEVVQSVDAIVWALNPRNDSLDNLANYFSRFAKDFFRVSPIRCRLDVPENLPDLPLTSEVRHHLYLAVKEALNNVARHSQAQEVWLRMSVNQGLLHVILSDDGRGFDQTSPEHGNGLRNIRKRMEEIHGACHLQSHPGQGTTVHLKVPVPTRNDTAP